jgi:hypothetical protein
MVVTKDGVEVITRFPAEELMVAGKRYFTATGWLPTTRNTESHKNIDYTGVSYGGAGLPDAKSNGADGHAAVKKTTKK